MAIKFLYIDDDPIATIKEIAKGLSVFPDKLIVSAYQHKKWSDILSFISEKQDDYDGILFDWNLSNKNEDGIKANFDIEALSQQIKRNVIEKKGLNKDFPIILCSANYKFSRIFKKELTSHDLFDEIYDKEEFNDNTKKVITELISLADGYKYISKNLNKTAPLKSLKDILNIDDSDFTDYRFEEYLKSLIRGGKPVHEIARFLLESLIKVNGILVDKYILASRLGVDIINQNSKSQKNWDKLTSKISDYKYKGAFNKFKELWWMNSISEWWLSLFETQLGELEGPQRVKLLNKKFDLDLTSIDKTDKSKNTLFWVICEETCRPIAIEDSVLLPSNYNKAPWEEDKYLSIDEAIKKDSKSIHPLERDRLKYLKKIHSKKRSE